MAISKPKDETYSGQGAPSLTDWRAPGGSTGMSRTKSVAAKHNAAGA